MPEHSRPPLFHGWKVVAVAFLVAFWAWGIGFYGPSIYLVALNERHGWPISLISTVITLYYMASAVIIVAAGDSFARFGPRRMVTLGAVGLAAGVVAIGHAASLPQLVGAFALLAVGWAFTSGAAVNTIVAPWFARRRGMATSLALNGASFGGFVMVPVWALLIGSVGLPTATQIVAAVMLASLVPLVLLHLVREPAALGLAPDDEPAPTGTASRVRPAGPVPGYRTLLGTPAFWTISGAFTLGIFSQAGFLTHQFAFLAGHMTTTVAALAVSLTTGAAIVGRLLAGLVVDRVDRRRAAAANFALQAAALAVMLVWPSLPGLFVGCAVYGLTLGNMISLPAFIVQVEFPPEAFARTVSLVVAINQFAAAFGPGTLGWLRDATGGYPSALALCLALAVVATAVVLVRPRAG